MRRLTGLLLVVLAGLGLVYLMEQWLPYAHTRAVVLLYVQAALVLCLVGVVGTMFGRMACRNETLVCSTIVLMLLLLLLDPYSAGRRGGHWGFQVEHPWQILVAAILGVALVTALIVVSQRRHLALTILSAEFFGFVLLNGIYAARDGLHIRGFAGESSSPFPLFLLLGGLALRAYVQFRMRKGEAPVEA